MEIFAQLCKYKIMGLYTLNMNFMVCKFYFSKVVLKGTISHKFNHLIHTNVFS